MKIVFLIDQFYKHGGIEKILSQKLNYLVKNKSYEVILVTINQNQKSFVYQLDKNVKHYDLAIDYRFDKSYYHPVNWIKLLTHYLRLKKIFKLILPDVAVSVQFFPDQYFLPFLKVKKTIKEIHFMGDAIKGGLNKLDYFLFHKIIPNYSHLVLLNKDELKFYTRFKNIEVIPNFIESPNENIQDELIREKVIISAGRLAPVKQFNHLIEAFSKIAYKYPDWTLEIYGDENGVSKHELKSLVKNNNLDKQIFILSATPNITNIMSKSSIFALTSKTECFPMVLLEAQQAGLPIISYDCKYGPKNIINHLSDGLLVLDQNIDDFANKLDLLIKDEGLRNKLRKNAVENAKRFEENEIMKKWISLFEL